MIDFFQEKVMMVSFNKYFDSLNLSCKEILKASLFFVTEENLEKYCKDLEDKNTLSKELFDSCEMGGDYFEKVFENNKFLLALLCHNNNTNEKSYIQVIKKF